MPRVQGQESARANPIDGVGARLDICFVRRWVPVAAAGIAQADDRKQGATCWLGLTPPQSYYLEQETPGAPGRIRYRSSIRYRVVFGPPKYPQLRRDGDRALLLVRSSQLLRNLGALKAVTSSV